MQMVELRSETAYLSLFHLPLPVVYEASGMRERIPGSYLVSNECGV